MRHYIQISWESQNTDLEKRHKTQKKEEAQKNITESKVGGGLGQRGSSGGNE